MLLKVANNKQTKNEAYRKSDEKRSDEDDEENFEEDIGSSDIPFHPVNCAAFNTFCEKLLTQFAFAKKSTNTNFKKNRKVCAKHFCAKKAAHKMLMKLTPKVTEVSEPVFDL